MAYNKKTEFQTDEIQLAVFAKALSHPARVAILSLLSQKNSCICGDIVAELPLSQSTVSQHLKELKEAGLITGEIDGPRVCYCLNKTKIREAEQLLQNLFTNLAKTSCAC